MKNLLILLVFAFLAAPNVLQAQAPSTYKYSGYVNDYANVINDADEAKLQSELKKFDEDKGVQFAVVTVGSFNGNEPEVFAQELFHNWGIGHKKDNTGVLYIICPKERKQRIHTGYGLESTLTDLICKRILRDTEPSMKENTSDAIIARANAVVSAVSSNNDTGINTQTVTENDQAKNEYATNPDTSVPTEEGESNFLTYFLTSLVLAACIAFVFWLYKKRLKEKEEKQRSIDMIDSYYKRGKRELSNSLERCEALLNNKDASVAHKNAVSLHISNLQTLINSSNDFNPEAGLKMSDSELQIITKHAYTFSNDSSKIDSELDNIEKEIATLVNASTLSFYCENLRRETTQQDSLMLSERDKVNRSYPTSVWCDFDYTNFKQNIAYKFEQLDKISDEAQGYKNNLTLDNAKKVEALYKKYNYIKSEITEISKTVLSKNKQIEYAAGVISTNAMDEAYVLAKRNVEAQFVSSNTVERFNKAVKLCLAYRNKAGVSKDPIQLASEFTAITKELSLVSEKALYDVRKHKEDIEEAIRAEKRRKEREEEEERRRLAAIAAAAYSSSSYSSSSSSDSYSSGSSSDSFSFGGGDSGGGGSNDSW